MTNDSANVAQADMLIAEAPIEDLRALCQMQQELLWAKDARIKVLETQLELAKFAAEINKDTLERMYAGN